MRGGNTSERDDERIVKVIGGLECKGRVFFFFSSRRRHTRYWRDWSSDVCSSDLNRLNRIKNLRMKFFAVVL